MKDICIFAACSDLGLNITGSQLGPDILLNNINNNKICEIKKIEYNKNYQKELEKDNLKKNLNELNLFNSKLYDAIKNSVKENSFILNIGGDHSIAIASALASISQNQNKGIIWFDAHGDYHTFQTTMSGNIHGLPFAAITNYEKNLLTNFHTENFYNPKNAVLLGARDIDLPDELNNLKKAGVTIITTEDIHQYGIEAMAQKAIEIASNGTDGIHISFDLDVIDPIIAPGVSVPVPNGINLDEAYGFVDMLIKNKEKINSLDLVEFNPLKDKEQKTEKIALHILNKLLNSF